MANYKLSVVIEKDKKGYYAYCPELQGCYTQGDTYEEVIKNIKDAIKLHLENYSNSRKERFPSCKAKRKPQDLQKCNREEGNRAFPLWKDSSPKTPEKYN